VSFPQDYHFPPGSRLAVVSPMKLDWRIDDDYGGCEGSRGGIHRRTGFDFIAGTGIGGKAALDV